MMRFFRALFQSLRHCWEWLVLHATGRDLAGERAQRLEAERQAAQTEAERREAEARHEELVSATEAQTVETRLLRQAISRQAQPMVTAPSVSVSQRREEIARLSRSHDVVIRSSQWRDDEPEDEVVVALRRA